MAGIKIGSNDIKSVYIGDRMANSVYLGSTLLWAMFIPRVATFAANGTHFTYKSGDPSFLSRSSVLDGGPIILIDTLTPVTLNVRYSSYPAGTVIPAGTKMRAFSFSNNTTVVFTEASDNGV